MNRLMNVLKKNNIIFIHAKKALEIVIISKALVLLVIAIGFEPMTVCLEGRCSIQLSYATALFAGAKILM